VFRWQDDEPEDAENHLIPHSVICLLTPDTYSPHIAINTAPATISRVPLVRTAMFFSLKTTTP
jgi:hypothetical protein